MSTKLVLQAPLQTTWHTPLAISAELLQGESTERVYFLFRTFGQSEYTKLEMELIGNAASITVPANQVLPPFLEFYLVILNRDGTTESYPIVEGEDPITHPPEKVIAVAVRSDDDPGTQVLFLSPEPNARLASYDVLISVSLLRAESTVVRSATRILLDNADVTANAVFSEDIIVYSPENVSGPLRPGLHRATVNLFDNKGAIQQSASIAFTVTGEVATTEPVPSPVRYGVSLQLESRHEHVSDAGTWYNRGGLQLIGSSGEWRARSNLFVTSDEDAGRQPQNRYFFGVESSWLKAGYGDAYPSFPSLLLNGKRVRGVHSSIDAGFMRVDLALGKTSRAIDGKLLKVIGVDTLGIEQERDPNAAYAQIDPHTWGKFSYGTFARDLFVIRPSFGSGETWRVGLTWLKSKDDVGSIKFGVRPQENLVVGFDFSAQFDSKRIIFAGQGAMSAFNSDISSGNFTDAYIDSVYPKDASRLKKLRDILDDFITVNDNLRPLSFKKLSTLAYDLSLNLDYFDNQVKASYLFRGSDYNSFGQTFIRKDIRGLNLTDRIRLVKNQVFLSVGYERLTDNTSNTKVATTTYSNISTALSYYPKTKLPTLTVGFARLANDNGLSVTSPDSASVVDERTHRLFVQSSYDFELGPRHSASVSFATSDRNDESLRQFDVQNTTLSFGLTTRFLVPVQTSAEVSVNLNELPTGIPGIDRDFNYTTMSFAGRFGVLDEALWLQATVSPSFGDFDRTLLSGGAEWRASSSTSILLDYSYIYNHIISDENFWSLRLRYDL